MQPAMEGYMDFFVSSLLFRLGACVLLGLLLLLMPLRVLASVLSFYLALEWLYWYHSEINILCLLEGLDWWSSAKKVWERVKFDDFKDHMFGGGERPLWVLLLCLLAPLWVLAFVWRHKFALLAPYLVLVCLYWCYVQISSLCNLRGLDWWSSCKKFCERVKLGLCTGSWAKTQTKWKLPPRERGPRLSMFQLCKPFIETDLANADYPWEEEHGKRCPVVLSVRYVDGGYGWIRQSEDDEGHGPPPIIFPYKLESQRAEAAEQVHSLFGENYVASGGYVYYPNQFQKFFCPTQMFGSWCRGQCRSYAEGEKPSADDCWAASFRHHLQGGCCLSKTLVSFSQIYESFSNQGSRKYMPSE